MKTQRLAVVSSLALTGVLALAGCGGGNSGSTNPGGGGGETQAAESGDGNCFSGNLTAEGSSAQKNAFEEAVNLYSENCQDAKISYNPTGSGAGIKQFIAGQVNFAGSDSALKTEAKDGKIEQQQADAACASPAWNIPMVTGPIAIAYNVPGVEKLTLTPAVTADIFTGKVKTWNDPAIAKVNAGVNLPATPIKPFFRSDESGTTENFTKYLAAAAPKNWTAEPAKKWSGKGQGVEKSAGVTNGVKGTEGGITYTELSYAKDAGLKYAQIDNGAGPVELTGESVGKAVAAAKPAGEGNDLKLKLDYATKEAGAYPILLVTYEIVCSTYKDQATGTNVRSFLTSFASQDTQTAIEEIGYAPLPAEVRSKVETAIAAIK
ncbi:phosphate ABC transporter substrate-binding protein PstS [Agilicoccus flavus]|uniref:phosphate ABC transporter substrate-binding protein PstS n=1 Tax=Agilicoccus flavus TaxID=2775968 RepID=UPI001CF68C60|nr:phosphate ABC transporter substrate-binding protein PstS [Agilicoccus flavus]